MVCKLPSRYYRLDSRVFFYPQLILNSLMKQQRVFRDFFIQKNEVFSHEPRDSSLLSSLSLASAPLTLSDACTLCFLCPSSWSGSLVWWSAFLFIDVYHPSHCLSSRFLRRMIINTTWMISSYYMPKARVQLPPRQGQLRRSSLRGIGEEGDGCCLIEACVIIVFNNLCSAISSLVVQVMYYRPHYSSCEDSQLEVLGHRTCE